MRLDDALAGTRLTEIGAEPLTADDPPRIGQFPVRAVLGTGGMGRVYLGVSPQGPVAVKQVRPDLAKDEEFVARFYRELDNQGRLPPGVSPRLQAIDRTARPPWFAVDYVPGVTLQRAAELAGGRLPVSGCWFLLRELAIRLDALAGYRMVHRDLKPSNIMLTADGLTIIDFGLSLMELQSSLTSVNGAVGTLPYMAPEQLRQPRPAPTPALDVFALGSVITYAAIGEPPFGSDRIAGHRIEHQEPYLDALRAADPELARVVASCLAKDPADRPAAAELTRLSSRAPRTPSWPAPVAESISLRSSLPRWITVTRSTGEITGVTRSTGQITGPTQETGQVSRSEELARKRAGKRRKRGKLLVIVIPAVIVVGGGITALQLSPFTSSKSGGGNGTPTASITPASPVPTPPPTHTTPSPTPTVTSSSPRPATSSATPKQAARNASVVSFASYDMLENKTARLCLADSGNFTAESLPCAGGGAAGWKAVREPGNKFELVNQSYGDCATDYGEMIQTAPCAGDETITTFWRIIHPTSGGALLVDDGTGECMTSARTSGNSGFSTTTCDPSDPKQVWFDAGKA